MTTYTIDIQKRNVLPPLLVTEYDAMSRFFSITLYDNGSAYTPPTNAQYTLWYEVGLNTGWYDTITLPDDSTRDAVTASSNVFTCELAEDATHGNGKVALMITGDDGYQLTITGIEVRSDYIPAESAGETQNYYNALYNNATEVAAIVAGLGTIPTITVSGTQLVVTTTSS